MTVKRPLTHINHPFGHAKVLGEVSTVVFFIILTHCQLAGIFCSSSSLHAHLLCKITAEKRVDIMSHYNLNLITQSFI